MVYLERKPSPPLNFFVRTFWYARIPSPAQPRERILPSGCMQLIVNLAREFLVDCFADGSEQRNSASIIVGARSIYEMIDTADMAELIGVVFQPGGFPPMFSEAADLFRGRNVPLECLWGARAASLRERLCGAPGAALKLRLLESLLLEGMTGKLTRSPILEFALPHFSRNPRAVTVKETARQTGWSVRRFSQLFKEQVGVSPKVWCRIQRFQRAVAQLHQSADMPWPELALDCGYYDQSHFVNDFRAFSGINPSTYRSQPRQWANHIAAP